MLHPALIEALSRGCNFPSGLFTHTNHTLSNESALCINQALRSDSLHSTKYPYNLCFCTQCASDVEVFGNHLIRSAIRCLPDKFESANGEQTTRTKLVSLWEKGSRGSRIEIGRLLASTFYPRRHKDGRHFDNSDGKDSWDQPMERVLPNLYGKWVIENGVDNRPNCLGKFQLLIALGDLLKVKMLAISPLYSSSCLLQKYRTAACSAILACYEKTRLMLEEKRRESLEKIISHGKKTDERPPLQHFAVIYEIGNNEWMLVDPNSGMTSIIEERDALLNAYNTLEHHKDTAPGATLLFEANNSSLCEKLLRQTKEACEKITALKDEISSAKNWDKLKQIFHKHGLIKEMLTENVSVVNLSDLELRFDSHAQMLWKKFNSSCPDNLEHLTVDQFDELRSTVIYRYLVRHESEMLSEYQVNLALGRITHPLNEISRPHFRAAHATISHVALDLSENLDISSQTEQILCTFGIAEASLYNVVCTNRGFSEHANRAKKILMNQPKTGTLAQSLFSNKGEGYVA